MVFAFQLARQGGNERKKRQPPDRPDEPANPGAAKGKETCPEEESSARQALLFPLRKSVLFSDAKPAIPAKFLAL
jgi:hypothetical protein